MAKKKAKKAPKTVAKKAPVKKTTARKAAATRKKPVAPIAKSKTSKKRKTA